MVEFILGVPNTDLAAPLSTVQGGSQWHRGGYRCAVGLLPAHKETKTADPAPYSNPVKCQALSADAQTKLALTKGPREQSRHLKSIFDLIVYHRAHFREAA